MGIKVLSLFDGMACGLQALKQAGIPVAAYHAFEIDKYAVQIAKKNHPEIIHHGSVVGSDFSLFSGVDLLIGGSPCQGFSFAGNQLAFADERSALFFEFIRAGHEARPKNFMLENVPMRKEHEDIISKFVGGVAPIRLNSRLVSAQQRERLYWCNWAIEPMSDRQLTLADVIDTTADKWLTAEAAEHPRTIKNVRSLSEKSRPLLATMYKLQQSNGMTIIECPTDSSKKRCITPLECERLQTLPDNYTAGVSSTQRYKMLGNGWTIDVISHILRSYPYAAS